MSINSYRPSYFKRAMSTNVNYTTNFLKSLYTEREKGKKETQIIQTQSSIKKILRSNFLKVSKTINIVSEENLPFYSGDIVKIWRYVVKKQIVA